VAISAPTQRTVGAATAVTNANTASWTPAANALQVMVVHTARAAGASNVPTVVRSAISWAWVAGIAYIASGTRRRVDVFRNMEAAPAAGAANVDYAAQTQDNIQWEVVDVAGVLTTGTKGADAIRQAVTDFEATTVETAIAPTGLADFANAGNATILAVGVAAAVTLTAGALFTISGQGSSGANTVGLEYRLKPDVTPRITSSVAALWGAVAIELVTAVGAASGTLTSRPDGTAIPGSWTLTGAATHHAAHSDDSDASYSAGTGTGSATLVLEMQDLWSDVYHTRLVSVTQRWRIAAVGGTTAGLRRGIEWVDQGIVSYVNDQIRTPAQGTSTLSYVWATAPHGGAWTRLVAYDLWLHYAIFYDGGSTLRLFESYLDLLFNDRPTLTPTAPASGSTVTDTTRPTVEWTYSDPEGDALERWKVRIFTDAQYLAGGFDPEASAAFAESGEQVSAGTSWTPSIDLPNDVYRAYAWGSDVGAGGIYGVGSYVGWTQNVVAPTVPVVTANAENAAARIRVVVQGSGAGPGDPPAYFDVEYSDDGGTTWAALRNGSAVTPSGTYAATVYDYEAPPRQLRSYRAKAVRVVGTLLIGSAWATASATLTPARSWLKDPLDPALNAEIECGPFIENEERKERVGIFEPYGSDHPVVVAGALTGWDGQTAIYARTEAAREGVEALLAVQHAVLFQTPEGTNRYLRILTRRRSRHTCDVYSYPITYVETGAP
jgi:hypothetical protein